MWILYAFLSAFFSGVTGVLAKCGMRQVDSTLGTALRTVVVLLFSWVMVFLFGDIEQITTLSRSTWLFLILSGMATGASWLCYFKALQIGEMTKVVPIDKLSTVLTMLLASIFLGEKMTIITVGAMALIGVGTVFMSLQPGKQGSEPVQGHLWLWYAIGAAVFASLTSILGKLGIAGVDARLGTAIRTVVVLGMAWGMVFYTKKQHLLPTVDKKSWIFLSLSGVTTGMAWLCYYSALQIGPASVIAPIDKLSIVITVLFAYIVFKERLSKKAFLGFCMLIGGTLLLLV